MRYDSPYVHLLGAAGALTVGFCVAGAQALPLAADPHAGSPTDLLIRVAGDQGSQGGGGEGNAGSGNGNSTGAGNGPAGNTGDAAGADGADTSAGAGAGDSGGKVGADVGADVGGTDVGASAGASDDGVGTDAGASAGGVDAGASAGSGDGSVGAGAGASVGGTDAGASAGTGSGGSGTSVGGSTDGASGGTSGSTGTGSASTGATGNAGGTTGAGSTSTGATGADSEGSGTAATGGAASADGSGGTGAPSGPPGGATTSVAPSGEADTAASIDARPTAHDSPVGAGASIDVPAVAVGSGTVAPSQLPRIGCSDPAKTGACAPGNGEQLGTRSRPDASKAPARTAPSDDSNVSQGLAAAPQPPAMQPAALTGGGLGISLVGPVRNDSGLVVQGVIVNASGRDQTVPAMQLSLVNKANQVVQRYKLEPPAVTLANGEHKAFKTVIQPVPPGITRVTTAFIAQPAP
jgi:hypothetical protein